MGISTKLVMVQYSHPRSMTHSSVDYMDDSYLQEDPTSQLWKGNGYHP